VHHHPAASNPALDDHTARIKAFEKDLKRAVKAASLPDAKLNPGAHCRFCPAKPTCPEMTGAVDRALKVKLDAIDDNMLGAYASNAVLLQGWIDDLNALVQSKIEKGYKIPGWKLVAKRGTRKWAKEDVVHWRALGLMEKAKVLKPARSTVQKYAALLKWRRC
jgi:hypothetical protein